MQRQCEVQVMRIAVQHAMINNPDRLDPEQSRRPGRERARLLGGEGTPRVTEFAAAELGGRLEISTYSATSLMADSLDLAIRLPRLWARVEALEVRASYARYVAKQTRALTFEQADFVDEAVVESADGRVTWTRFMDIVEGAIVASDPQAAAEREKEAASAVYAWASRSTELGLRGFHIRAPFPVVSLLDARVQWFADVLAALGDERTTDERRVAAVAILADPPTAMRLMSEFQSWRDRPEDPEQADQSVADEPVEEAGDVVGEQPGGQPGEPVPPRDGPKPEIDWGAVLPVVQLFVHVYGGRGSSAAPGSPAPGSDPPGDPPGADPPGDPPPRPRPVDRDVLAVARVEEHGPVTTQWVQQFLGEQARFTITPVLDLARQAPSDAYEIPRRHRAAVHLMTPADIFPWGTSLSRRMQIDHTVPFRHGPVAAGAGQSRIGNYGPMSGLHHRLKTHGGWDVEQPFPGIYVWRDPHGEFYLVDHTGTRRLGGRDSGAVGRPDGDHSQHRAAAVEFYRTDRRIEFDLTA